MSGVFEQVGRFLGRASVPVVRKTKWIWSSLAGDEEAALRAEVEFGTTLAAELRTTQELVRDPALSGVLGDLLRRLGAPLKDQRRGFRCEVIRDDVPNAMALPGGFIFLSHSLLELGERRTDELAFILGHEMAHVIRNHAWDRLLNQTASRVASVVALRAGPLGGWLRQRGLAVLQSAHAQDCEFEADELGLRLGAAAGFATGGALAFLRRLDRLGAEATARSAYLASHPPAVERLARLGAVGRQLTPAPGQGSVPAGSGREVED
ncbi:MAG: hypothetical protein FJ387_19965 [Verrucomicrobia bacterium]|nr:hypothetical protein [Verrucomicrobiota bacterium]